MEMSKQKAAANRLLCESGLLDELSRYGNVHIVGSYSMNLMVWNDLDIDVENEAIALNHIHEILKFILDRFSPVWFEGKQQVHGDTRKNEGQ